MNRRRIQYRSLYDYLTDWCDYTHGQAKAEVERRMTVDGAHDRARRRSG